MTNICYIWFVLSHSLPGGGILCAVSGVCYNIECFKKIYIFLCVHIRRGEISALCTSNKRQEWMIVVGKFCLHSYRLKPLLCLRREIAEHDLYLGHVGHKVLIFLKIRIEMSHSMLCSVKSQCRVEK